VGVLRLWRNEKWVAESQSRTVGKKEGEGWGRERDWDAHHGGLGRGRK
jgi:hypothetical protein